MSVNIPQDLAETLAKIGRAEWGATAPETADGHAEHIRTSVNITAQEFGQTEPQPMNGLYVEGTETIICHTGTSPNSANIARLLTGAWNHLFDAAVVPDHLSTITALEAEVGRLREALENIWVEYGREGSKLHHLKRVVAIQYRAALKTKEQGERNNR